MRGGVLGEEGASLFVEEAAVLNFGDFIFESVLCVILGAVHVEYNCVVK